MDYNTACTISETMQILGRSDKSIRRYIQEGRLEAELRGNQYLISRESIDNLHRQPVQYISNQEISPEHVEVLTKQLEELGNNLEELSREMSRLVEEVSSQEKRIAELEAQATPAKVEYKPPMQAMTPTSTPVDLPPGTLSLRDFAEQLEIHRTSFLGQVKAQEANPAFAHIARPRAGREHTGERERFFTPQQQEAIRRWRAEHPHGH